MAYNLHVIKTTDFVRLDGHGKPDLIESRRALESLAKACVERGTTAALLDVRDVRKNDLALADLYNLISAFQAIGFRREHKLALLHRFSGGEKSEFFALCASNRGWNVRAFDDFERAMEWFGMDIPVQ